ncbi:MAG: serine/threonine protein kinase [Candidatus Wallbacteria bacterium]|nr:serine/threonine protein kinase [Candidatus Wallbacteria bacterium]
MGTVYRAVQISLDRPVALKVLLRSSAWMEDAEQRFLEEARLAARISHPNVVRVLGSGRGALGLYIAFELIDGLSLRASIEKGIPPAQALELAAQTLHGLQAVHDSGAVHRDVKPENILLDPSGNARLTDLGIAKELTGGGRRTRTGLLFGTPQYMSPEQCSGRPAGAASDIYAAGVVAYEMLAGRPPFASDNPIELVEAHLRQAPDPPSRYNTTLPAEWDRAILQALAKAPADRYESAARFAEALEQLSVVSSGSGAKAARSALGLRASAQTLASAGPSGGGAGRPGDQVPTALVGAARRRGVPGPVPRPAAGPTEEMAGEGSTRGRMAPWIWGAVVVGAAGALVAAWSVPAPLQVATAPKPPADSPARTVATTEAARVETPEELLATLGKVMARDLDVAAWVEPHPDPAARVVGSTVFLGELLLVDARSIRKPVLRIQIPGEPGATPEVSFESVGPGSPPMARLQPGELPSTWQAQVPDGLLQDGYNWVRIVVPRKQFRTVPVVDLVFERGAGFAPSAPAGPATTCSDCCPSGEVRSRYWQAFDLGKLNKSIKIARELERDWPRCELPPLYRAYSLIRIAEERGIAGDNVVILASGFLEDDAEPPDGPAWKLWREGCELMVRTAKRHPQSAEAWYRLAICSRQMGRLAESVRAARWCALLNPAGWANWERLARSELDAIELGKALGGGSRTRDLEMALAHARRSALLSAGNGEFDRHNRSLALSLQGRVLALLGRPGEARRAYQEALALHKGLQEAYRGLQELEVGPAGKTKPPAGP